ncbi:MAG: VWA domain-containing protein [Myxococcota bacterium]
MWLRTQVLLSLFACGGEFGEPGLSESSTPVSGVGQGGAQDFGQFRQILDEGGIPGPETLDDVGFFAEHRFEFPDPDCGDEICIHGRYGAMGNMIDGSICTVVLLGMNTTQTLETVERPGMNLTVIVDKSGSMSGSPIAEVRAGLTAMQNVLQPDDLVTLVAFGSDVEVLVQQAPPGALLQGAIAQVQASGSTDLYEGLRIGLENAAEVATPDRQSRVLLLSDGQPTEGIQDTARMLGLAEAYQDLGISLSTIGLGNSFDAPLLRDLAEEGAGAFYFVEDETALTEVFVEEASVFLVPLAEDAQIELSVNSNWDVRGVFGTKLFDFRSDRADIEVPRLQLAGRTDAPDTAPQGRRGGGGGIVVELLPQGDGVLEGDVGTIDLSYRIPGTEDIVTQQVTVEGPEQFRDGDRWFFDPSVEKSFVTLNLYVAFQQAAEAASRGDDGAALGVLNAVAVNVAEWLQSNSDSDILDDLVYVDRFRENLLARTPEPQLPPEPNPPWPQD